MKFQHLVALVTAALVLLLIGMAANA